MSKPLERTPHRQLCRVAISISLLIEMARIMAHESEVFGNCAEVVSVEVDEWVVEIALVYLMDFVNEACAWIKAT